MTSVEVVGTLAVLAVGMAVTSAVAVKWAAFAVRPLRATIVQFILLMMAGMFVGVLVYFAIGRESGILAGLWVASAIMSASVLVVFVGFARETRLRVDPRLHLPATPPRAAFLASVVGLVIANEFLMGWSFSLLSGTLSASLGPNGRDALTVLSAAITSPWFVFPMALEMALTLRWLLPEFPRVMGRFLVIQPAIMVCSPPTLAGFAWVVSTAAAASGLMAVVVAFFLVALLRNEPLRPPVITYVTSLILSLGLMAAGLYVWVEFSSAGLFALSLLVQMVVFLTAVTDPSRYTVDRVQDLERFLGGPIPG